MFLEVGKDSRVARVCGLLLLISVLVSGQDSTRTSSTIDDAVRNATTKLEDDAHEEVIGTVVVGKPEARWEDSPAPKSSKGVEWKSGRQRWSKDSYLEAWRHSRTSTDPREGVVAADASSSGSSQRRREYTLGPVYSPKDSGSTSTSSRIVHGSIDRDSFSMAPSDAYSLPTRMAGDFARIQNSYGPPQPQPQPPRISYGVPSNVHSSYGDYSGGTYLPPQQAYGPPTPTSGYSPSATYEHGAPYGVSATPQFTLPSIDFSWPFALKLNAFTLAKILLKLVIFKMIVKFIAVICLLLFIPKLEIKKTSQGDMDDDEGRRFLNADSRFSDGLNALTLVVSNAMDKYRNVNETRSRSTLDYETFERRARGALSQRDTWQDYADLLRTYVSEETRFVRTNS
ncbi:uncharacterized protein LOC128875638 [Hylaeus volcanicus]|uniref:uncharacterized protein LOC128875638 n=1 Tax=Hylaeus volcanicus TaxID=313075 RepID=UPI0023B82B5B|nr:uncharacterized protein LOC128875638 [Hylaeus volcanicus]